MLTFFAVIVIFVVTVFGLFLAAVIKADNRLRKTRDEGVVALKQAYQADEAYVSHFDLSLLGIRWSDNQVFFGSAPDQIVSYSLSDLRSAEIEVDGGRVMRSKGTIKTRPGLSGGLNSRSVAQETDCITKVTLVAKVRDRTNPIHRITFWESSAPGPPKHQLRKTFEEVARYVELLDQGKANFV